MAEESGTVFGQKATEQIAKTVREVARQMVNPRGHRGRWQHQSTGPFWAVNIGSLAAATHPLTGHSTGVAGLVAYTADGDDLVVTDNRAAFIRRDGSGTIADGTLIQLDIVSGKLTVVWSDCDAHEELEGLEAAP